MSRFKFRHGIGLQAKVVGSTVIVLVTVLSLFFIFAINTIKSRVLSEMENSALLLAQSLERGITLSGAMENRKLLQEMVMEYNKVEEINEIYVIDRNFNIIAHPDSSYIGKKYQNHDVIEAMGERKSTNEFKIEKENHLFDVVIPVIKENKVLGAIEVEIHLAKFEELINTSIRKAFLAVVTITVLLALFIIGHLYRIVLKPIYKIVLATQEIAAGRFEPVVGVPLRRDEIGFLARSFNDMIMSLKKLSEQDKSANPLTGLPGNLLIQQELSKKIQNNKPFNVLYVDIDDFKGYNDKYGFQYGDEAIKLTAKVINEVVSRCEREKFIGHIGGDDFVVVTTCTKPEEMAWQIIEKFKEAVKSLVSSQENLKKLGTSEYLTVSVAILEVSPGRFKDIYELSREAARLKKWAKMKGGSTVAV